MHSIVFYVPGEPRPNNDKQALVWPNFESIFKDVIDSKKPLTYEILASIVGKIKKKTFVHRYKPKDIKKWREWVSQVAEQMKPPKEVFCKPVKLKIEYVIVKPRTSKRIVPDVRPDLTNLTKNLEDGLNKIMFKDDCQVIEKLERKFYDDVGLAPGAYITVSYFDSIASLNEFIKTLDNYPQAI